MKKSKTDTGGEILGLSNSIPGKPSAIALCVLLSLTCNAASLYLPEVTITELTHTYGHFAPFGPTTVVADGAATGQFTQSGFSATLTGSEIVTLRFEAPVGQKFVIHAPPAGFGPVSLNLAARWWAGTSDSIQNPVLKSFTFENLVGPTPSRTYSSDIIGAGGRLIEFTDVFTVAPGTEFTAIELSASYAFSIPNPSVHNFFPDMLNFSSSVTSSQMLGDGTLMTLEAVPEPTVVALMLCSIGAFAWFRRSANRTAC